MRLAISRNELWPMILHVPFRAEQRRIARADGICHWSEHAGQVYWMLTESIYYHATLDQRIGRRSCCWWCGREPTPL